MANAFNPSESTAPAVAQLRAFLPSKDFKRSCSFYLDLGFEQNFDGEIAIFRADGFEFIVNTFYDQVYAENCMMQLVVRDLAAWWKRIDVAHLTETYSVRPPIAPALQPWGREVGYLFDPCGVLWHIAQETTLNEDP